MGPILSILFVLFLGVTSTTFVNDLLDSMADKKNKEIFQTFHYLHEKTYEINSEEGLKRYRIFKRNNEWIKNENAKLGEKIYGITEYTDLTNEEFVEQYLMKPDEFEEGVNELSKEGDENSTRFLTEKHEHTHIHHHYYENDPNYKEKIEKEKELDDPNCKEEPKKEKELEKKSKNIV